jgi:cell division protein FtsA
MNSNKLIAIDFGSTHITAMAAEVLEDGSIKIYSEESKVSDDVKWGIIEKPSGASFKVSELLKLIKNSARLSDITHVSVPVSAKSMRRIPSSVSRFVGKPNVVTENLLVEMLEECQKKSEQKDTTVFDVIPASYALDGERQDDPVGQNAIQITAGYNVFIGNSTIKSELERCFDRTGLILEYCPLAALAISTVVFDEQELMMGCALINLGATTTTLAVYNDGILQNLLVVPLGAYNITKDIQELGISEANAERLKCLKGSAMESMVENPVYILIASENEKNPPVKISTKFLATIIEARLEEIMQPIFAVLDRLNYPLEAGIVISGGGSKLKNIPEFIAEKTGIYPRYGDHSDWLSEGTNERFRDSKYAPLIGTILLTDEYRKSHPLEEEPIVNPKKKPKLPKGNRMDKLAGIFTNFFGEENENKF